MASPSSYTRSFSPSSVAATDGESSAASRRTSFSSNGRTASSGGGPGSRSSSRSTSFNLPSDVRDVVRLDGRQPGDEVEVGEEMDEESACYLIRIYALSTHHPSTPLAAAKHAAFVRARGRHYSNEAEAMKVGREFFVVFTPAELRTQRAKSLIDEEEDTESVASVDPSAETDSQDITMEDEVHVNGVVHAK
jgi:protein phosphatase inhibitor 2